MLDQIAEKEKRITELSAKMQTLENDKKLELIEANSTKEKKLLILSQNSNSKKKKQN